MIMMLMTMLRCMFRAWHRCRLMLRLLAMHMFKLRSTVWVKGPAKVITLVNVKLKRVRLR